MLLPPPWLWFDMFLIFSMLIYYHALPFMTGTSPLSLGPIHSWRFDQDADLAAGAYYTLKNWNIYLWGNDLLRDHPRVVVGIDFTY